MTIDPAQLAASVPAKPLELTPPISVRDAGPADAARIADLIGQWAAAGLTIPRSEHDIRRVADHFVLVERGGVVIACAALEKLEEGLGEVRSVAVDSEAVGIGAGRAAVHGLVARARHLGVERLVLLSRIPAFFARLGFEELTPETAPASYLQVHLPGMGRTHQGRSIMAMQVRPAQD